MDNSISARAHMYVWGESRTGTGPVQAPSGGGGAGVAPGLPVTQRVPTHTPHVTVVTLPLGPDVGHVTIVTLPPLPPVRPCTASTPSYALVIPSGGGSCLYDDFHSLWKTPFEPYFMRVCAPKMGYMTSTGLSPPSNGDIRASGGDFHRYGAAVDNLV